MTPWFKSPSTHGKPVASDDEEKPFVDNVDDTSTKDLEIQKPIANRFVFSLRAVFIFLGGIAMGLALMSTIINLSARKKLPAPSRNGYHVTKIVNSEVIEGYQCGDTWQEAKALGCIYDVIASRWYAPECFDRESFEAMRREPGTNYTWFTDKEHTQPFPAEVAERGEFVLLFPLYNFHKIHCLYLWRKMHHALLNNLPLDDDLMEEDHTIHCTKNLLTWPDPHIQEVASIAHAGRPFCRREPLGVIPLEVL